MQLSFYAFELVTESEKTALRPRDIWEHMASRGFFNHLFNKKTILIRVVASGDYFCGAICSYRNRLIDTAQLEGQQSHIFEISPSTSGDWTFSFFKVHRERPRGVYAYHKGALALRPFCRLIQFPMLKSATFAARERYAAELVAANRSKSESREIARKKFQLSKAVVVGPCFKTGALESLVADMAKYSYFGFKFPEIDEDPYSNARPFVSSIQTYFRFPAQQQRTEILETIKSYMRRFGLVTGTIAGKNASGGSESIRINETKLALGSVDSTDWFRGKLDMQNPAEFPVYAEIDRILESNSEMF